MSQFLSDLANLVPQLPLIFGESTHALRAVIELDGGTVLTVTDSAALATLPDRYHVELQYHAERVL
jgi:hypothetical protein